MVGKQYSNGWLHKTIFSSVSPGSATRSKITGCRREGKRVSPFFTPFFHLALYRVFFVFYDTPARGTTNFTPALVVASSSSTVVKNLPAYCKDCHWYNPRLVTLIPMAIGIRIFELPCKRPTRFALLPATLSKPKFKRCFFRQFRKKERDLANNSHCRFGQLAGALTKEVGNLISFSQNVITSTKNVISFLQKVITSLGNVITVVGNVISFSQKVITSLGNVITVVGNVISFSQKVITSLGNVITIVGNVISFSQNVISNYRVCNPGLASCKKNRHCNTICGV
jgi:hypothetical protein